mgnify:CR=1 FL=1
MKKKTYLVVLALCTALAITACGTSADNKGETKSTAETQDTADKTDQQNQDRIQIKTAKIQLPEIQDLFLWMM